LQEGKEKKGNAALDLFIHGRSTMEESMERQAEVVRSHFDRSQVRSSVSSRLAKRYERARKQKKEQRKEQLKMELERMEMILSVGRERMKKKAQEAKEQQTKSAKGIVIVKGAAVGAQRRKK
jgi:16S rRNA C1402 (ribose-2'-O) methylase RsmI